MNNPQLRLLKILRDTPNIAPVDLMQQSRCEKEDLDELFRKGAIDLTCVPIKLTRVGRELSFTGSFVADFEYVDMTTLADVAANRRVSKILIR